MEAGGTELGGGGGGGGSQDYIVYYGPSSNTRQGVVPDATNARAALKMAMDLAYSPAAMQTRIRKFSKNTVLGDAMIDWLNKFPPTSFWETWCAVSG